MDAFLSGEELYGDDLSPAEIAAWFEDEREGYANLGAKNRSAYRYLYHGWNRLCGFRHLPRRPVAVAVGLGAAYGDEFLPIIDLIGKVIIVEPSAAFPRSDLQGVPTEYREPSHTGDLPCETDSVDLLTCFGVLHHIPNVSHVVREIGRCLKRGGHALIREPVVSMGDWRVPRPGLTKHERGIPLHLLRKTVASAGLQVVRETPLGFPLTRRLLTLQHLVRRGEDIVALLDVIASRLTAWNLRYHAERRWEKIGPSAVFLVARKL